MNIFFISYLSYHIYYIKMIWNDSLAKQIDT